MTAVKTSPMVVNDPPCLPLNHEIDAHVNMTPQDAQMTFPVFAPKMPSAPTTAGRTSSMVLNDLSCLSLHYEIDAYVNITPQDGKMVFPVLALDDSS